MSDERQRNIAFALGLTQAPSGGAASLRTFVSADDQYLDKVRSALHLSVDGLSELVDSLHLFEPGNTIYDSAILRLLKYCRSEAETSDIGSVPFAYTATCEPNGVAVASETGERCILLDVRFDTFFNRLTPYLLCAFGTRPPLVEDPLWLLPSIHVIYCESFWREPSRSCFFTPDMPEDLFRFCSQLQDGITLSIVAHELAHFTLGHLREDRPRARREQRRQELDADAEGCRVVLEYFRDRGRGDIAQFVYFCYFVFFSGVFLYERVERVGKRSSHPTARERIAAICARLGKSPPSPLPFGFLEATERFIRKFAGVNVDEMAAVAKKNLAMNGIAFLE